MIRILKFLATLVVLGFVGIVGYAYLGDMSPDRVEVQEPVELNVDG
ncbi:hypothetical protein OEW28_15085 [Defluviimonas sp. WL0002]|uniref:Uncharacterized protein n=1 Tax=Albidovulum marisflavi TaxID=2984159 RepID=A0ABT2ZFN5_9RHOB|nr:hypothetical protein [Defluviimonas sp. WL0002]MCV2869953.1 hypothetical protein [Defluviimonas sp. WL0002]